MERQKRRSRKGVPGPFGRAVRATSANEAATGIEDEGVGSGSDSRALSLAVTVPARDPGHRLLLAKGYISAASPPVGRRPTGISVA